MTDDDLRRRGIEALTRELGPDGAVSFLQRFATTAGGETPDKERLSEVQAGIDQTARTWHSKSRLSKAAEDVRVPASAPAAGEGPVPVASVNSHSRPSAAPVRDDPPSITVADSTAHPSPRLLARGLGSNAFLLCGLIAAPTLLLLALWLPQLPRQWAIHAVESHGGEVSFDDTIPEWVYGLFGERVERLEPVVGVDLDGKGIDDTLMPQLRLLSSAEVVWLNSARITDAGAAELLEFCDINSLDLGDSLVTEATLVPLLRRQPNLHTVWLQGTAAGDGALEALAGKAWLNDVTLARTRVTDEGLKHLATLPALDELDLSETSVGDAGMAHLASCPMLSTLNLSKTRVTDAGLEHLARMPALTSLSLPETPIDGSGLKFLTAARRLSEIDLDQTEVGNEGLEYVTAIKSLRSISLSGTRVTDEGLAKLANARQLSHIGLNGTATTRDGIARLRQALPECSVEESGHGEDLHYN